jgi:hypothetical protein
VVPTRRLTKVQPTWNTKLKRKMGTYQAMHLIRMKHWYSHELQVIQKRFQERSLTRARFVSGAIPTFQWHIKHDRKHTWFQIHSRSSLHPAHLKLKTISNPSREGILASTKTHNRKLRKKAVLMTKWVMNLEESQPGGYMDWMRSCLWPCPSLWIHRQHSQILL